MESQGFIFGGCRLVGLEENLYEKEERERECDENEKVEPTPAICAKKNGKDIMLRLGVVRACHGINKKQAVVPRMANAYLAPPSSTLGYITNN